MLSSLFSLRFGSLRFAVQESGPQSEREQPTGPNRRPLYYYFSLRKRRVGSNKNNNNSNRRRKKMASRLSLWLAVVVAAAAVLPAALGRPSRSIFSVPLHQSATVSQGRGKREACAV